MNSAEGPRILVVKLSSLGDTLHALPLAAELKRALGAEVHWAVHPEFAALVGCFACVDRVWTIPRRGSPRARLRAVQALRKVSFDAVVDAQGLLKSALVARCARAARRIGPSFHREGSRWFYDEVVGSRGPGRHALDQCLDLLDAWSLPRPAQPAFPLRLPEIDADLLPPAAGPRVALAPCSRWPTKNWPVEHFAALARDLAERHGAQLHAVGSSADRAVADRLSELAGVPLRIHCGSLTLPESAALLHRMDCLVSNDSGPMHIAVAVGTPCVVLFGPTLPDRTGPYGTGHRVVRSDLCPPCRSRRCRRGDSVCLVGVTPERVLSEVTAVLERAP